LSEEALAVFVYELIKPGSCERCGANGAVFDAVEHPHCGRSWDGRCWYLEKPSICCGAYEPTRHNRFLLRGCRVCISQMVTPHEDEEIIWCR
jgi:hypothetical protein